MALYQEATCPACNGRFPLMGELCRQATLDLEVSEDPMPRQTQKEGTTTASRIVEPDIYLDVNELESLRKEDLVRLMLAVADLQLYEGSFSAEDLGRAEIAMAAAKAWLKEPTVAHEEAARQAGSQALRLIAGAAATACSRMPELAAKTCVDAVMNLPADLRWRAIHRAQEFMERRS